MEQIKTKMKNIKNHLNQHGASVIRPDFIEILPTQLSILSFPVIAQAKYDGWFVSVVVEEEKISIYTRTRKYKEIFYDYCFPTGIYMGELLAHTQWSKNLPETLQNKIVLFDFYTTDPELIQYQDRWKAISFMLQHYKSSLFVPPITAIIENSYALFCFYQTMITHGFEGIVIRPVNNPNVIYKVKKTVTKEYYIVGYEKYPEGTIKNLHLATTPNGQSCLKLYAGLPPDIIYHKNPDTLIGKIVEVEGKGEFQSNAVRHAVFVRIREDLL